MHSDFLYSFQRSKINLLNSLTDFTKMIAPQTGIFQEMLETINFTPSKFHVNM